MKTVEELVEKLKPGRRLLWRYQISDQISDERFGSLLVEVKEAALRSDSRVLSLQYYTPGGNPNGRAILVESITLSNNGFRWETSGGWSELEFVDRKE